MTVTVQHAENTKIKVIIILNNYNTVTSQTSSTKSSHKQIKNY